MGQVKLKEVKSPEELIRKEKALNPWPGLNIHETSTHQTIKIFDLHFNGANLMGEQKIGQIIKVDNQNGTIVIRLQNGSISIGAVQPPNKSKMRAADWLRGLKAEIKNFQFE